MLCSNAHVIMCCAVSFFSFSFFFFLLSSCAVHVRFVRRRCNGLHHVWSAAKHILFIENFTYMILCHSSENEDAEGNRTNERTTKRTNEQTNERTNKNQKKLVGTSLHFARLAEVNAHKIYKRFNIFIFTLAHCTMPCVPWTSVRHSTESLRMSFAWKRLQLPSSMRSNSNNNTNIELTKWFDSDGKKKKKQQNTPR